MKPTRAQLLAKIIAVLDSIVSGPRITARPDAAKWAKWFRGIDKKP